MPGLMSALSVSNGLPPERALGRLFMAPQCPYVRPGRFPGMRRHGEYIASAAVRGHGDDGGLRMMNAITVSRNPASASAFSTSSLRGRADSFGQVRSLHDPLHSLCFNDAECSSWEMDCPRKGPDENFRQASARPHFVPWDSVKKRGRPIGRERGRLALESSDMHFFHEALSMDICIFFSMIGEENTKHKQKDLRLILSLA